jgi:hypothetical protein
LLLRRCRGGDFLVYYDKAGSYQYSKQIKSVWEGGSGPCLSNVSFQGVSADGAIAQESGLSLGRTDRYSKAFHSVKVQVLRDHTDASRLAFYQLGSDGYNYNTFKGVVYGNATGVEEYTAAALMASAAAPTRGYFAGHQRRTCGNLAAVAGEDGKYEYKRGSCWAWVPSGAETGETGGAMADRALIVREWRAVLGGQPVALPHLSLFKNSGTQVALELSPPPGVTTLREGDFVDALVEVLIVPMSAAAYWGADADLEASLAALDAQVPAPAAATSSLLPAGVSLKLAAAAFCNSETGCGSPSIATRPRWQIALDSTAADSSQLYGEDLVIEGDNGNRFPIWGVNHIAYLGSSFYFWPCADTASYTASMLTTFNSLFPVGTRFEVKYASDPVGMVAATAESARLRTHWQLAHAEAVENSPAVTVTAGSLERAHPLRVQVDALQSAAFTISSGLGFVPLSLVGLRTAPLGCELLRKNAAGEWEAEPQAAYWQTDYDLASQRYTMTTNVAMQPGVAAEFRCLNPTATAVPTAAPTGPPTSGTVTVTTPPTPSPRAVAAAAKAAAKAAAEAAAKALVDAAVSAFAASPTKAAAKAMMIASKVSQAAQNAATRTMTKAGKKTYLKAIATNKKAAQKTTMTGLLLAAAAGDAAQTVDDGEGTLTIVQKKTGTLLHPSLLTPGCGSSLIILSVLRCPLHRRQPQGDENDDCWRHFLQAPYGHTWRS